MNTLRAQVVQGQEAEIENQALLNELKICQTSLYKQLLGANVIGRDPSDLLQYLVLDRGSRDGIKVGMPVVSLGEPSAG